MVRVPLPMQMGGKDIGSWENDLLNGYATLYNEFGTILQEGIFKDDVFQYAQKKESGDFNKGLTAAQNGDFATALKEWKPLAEEGDAGAQYNLGFIYQNGEGVPQDYKKAVRWWRLAAEHGDAESQHNLANRYYYGEGVARDIVYAHMWKNLAFSNGFKPAKEHLKMFGQEMTSSQIETAQKLATECVKKNYKGC